MKNWYKEEMFVRFRILSVKGFAESIAAKMLILQPLMKKHNLNAYLPFFLILSNACSTAAVIYYSYCFINQKLFLCMMIKNIM